MSIHLINKLELFTPIPGHEELNYFGKLEIYHELFNNELDEASLSTSLNHIATSDKLHIRTANGQLDPIEYSQIRTGEDAVVDINLNDMEGYWVETSTDGINYHRSVIDSDTEGTLVVAEWLEGLRFRILVTNYEGLIYHSEIYSPRYKPVIAGTISTNVQEINLLIKLLSICTEYGYICNAYTVHEFGKIVRGETTNLLIYLLTSKHNQTILDSYIRVADMAKTARENNWEEVAKKLAPEIDTCIYYLILSAIDRKSKRNKLGKKRKPEAFTH